MLKCECVSNEHGHGIGNSKRCNRPAIYRVRVGRSNGEWSVCQYCIRGSDTIVARLRETKRKDS